MRHTGRNRGIGHRQGTRCHSCRLARSQQPPSVHVAVRDIALSSLLVASLVLGTLLSTACSHPPSTPPAPVILHISGSTSMQPLIRDLAAAYSDRWTHVSVDFSAVGSSAGLEALRRGQAQLAAVSRNLRPEEEYDTRTGERLLAYIVIAQDAMVVVVNEDNPLRQLALHEIRGIFEGRTSNWAEVGGHDADIVVISREDGSGAREAFEEAVMRGRPIAPTALIMPSSQAVSDYVRSHQGAIGYLSLGWLGPGMAALAIDGIQPTPETVEDGSYAIVRPFLLVSRPQPEGDTISFLQFASSPAGQAIVGRTYGRAGSMVSP